MLIFLDIGNTFRINVFTKVFKKYIYICNVISTNININIQIIFSDLYDLIISEIDINI